MLHLMVGLPCAGKTTFAKNLENETSGLRLTPDEWQLRLFGQDLDHPDHDWRHNTIEDLMWRVGAAALGHGVPVILDYGFWKRIERDDYRSRAASIGVPTTIHFLDTPKEILLRRVDIRNDLSKDETFVIPLEMMHEWYEMFERPDAEELSQNGIPAT
jgi:predicted kinase